MATVDVLSIARDAYHDLGPSTAVSLSLVAATAPLVILGWLSMVQSGFLFPLAIGMVVGVAWMALAAFMQKHRLRDRKRMAMLVSEMAHLNRERLGKILKGDNSPIPPWVHYAEFEKVTWLNNQIMEVWPYLNKAACEIIKDSLTPILEAYKVGIIKSLKVTRLTLGSEGPRVTGVKTYRSGEDEVTLEAEIDWQHDRDQKMVLEVQTTVIAGLNIKVTDIRATAAIKFVFKPLTDKIPGFGALLFSLREDPHIDMDISILGGNITVIPGIEKMIDNIIKASLQDMLVWPSRIVIPVAEGDYTYLELRPTGYLEIILLEGKDLPKTDVLGKTDPFLYLYVRQKQGSIKRSSVKMNNHNPVWNEVFFIEVEDLSTQTLTLRLMDEEKLEKAEYVGSRQYRLNQLAPNQPKDVWVDLVADPAKPNVGQKRGSLHLFVTYKPYNNEADAKNSPAHKAATATKKKKSDGISYELFRQRGVPEESLSSSGDEDLSVPAGAGEKGAEGSKKTGAVKKVVEKVCGHRTGKERPAQVVGMEGAEKQYLGGGETASTTASKVPASLDGGGF